jgi:AcrR family transcriptional regulator
VGSELVIELERRQRRRQETIEEVLDLAVGIMAEQGVAGLSLGELARRLGMRTPSLYVYFESKNALYDALFARSARLLLERMKEVDADAFAGADLEEILLEAATAFVGWCIANPVYSQLLFWRPVPQFEPSADAYEPAVQLIELTRNRCADLQERGLLRADVAVEDVVRDWTIVASGVISQQMSNAPNESFETGRFTSALPGLVAMFTGFYSAQAPTKKERRTER